MRKACVAVLGVVVALAVMTAFAPAAPAQAYNQWSDWHGTNRAGVDYRYKLAYYAATIQFRNTTSRDLTIHYAIWEPGADSAQKGTAYIKAEDTDGGHVFSPENGKPPSRVDVHVVAGDSDQGG